MPRRRKLQVHAGRVGSERLAVRSMGTPSVSGQGEPLALAHGETHAAEREDAVGAAEGDVVEIEARHGSPVYTRAIGRHGWTTLQVWKSVT